MFNVLYFGDKKTEFWWMIYIEDQEMKIWWWFILKVRKQKFDGNISGLYKSENMMMERLVDKKNWWYCLCKI